MFKKILIAEDLDSINYSITEYLKKSLKLPETAIEHSKFCDDALLKIKRSTYQQEKFELLITDLSFKETYRNENLKNGHDLIESVQKLHPKIKVIVYSIEDRTIPIRQLFTNLHINGFVTKGRNGLRELIEAVHTVYQDKTYCSPQLERILTNETSKEINDFDALLIEKISNGLTQKEIATFLKRKKISPNSVSSVEKRLNDLKIYFGAQNTPHLIAITKDLGFI